MRTRLWSAITVCAAACGPSVGGTSEGAGSEGATTRSESSSSGTTSTSGTSSTSSSEGTDLSADASTDVATSSESGDVERCVDGTFVGTYNGYFEYFDFTRCDTGERVWFEPNASYIECDNAWIVVEGSLCGPGYYGQMGYYDYQLIGDIVDGPCRASCEVEDPPAEQCGTFDEVCSHIDCRPAASTCPAGERCIASSVSGAPPWNSSHCVPESERPQPVGGACTSMSPWNDDCASGGYCDAGVCKQVCADDAECAEGELCRPCDVDIAEPRLEPLAFGICSVDPIAC